MRTLHTVLVALFLLGLLVPEVMAGDLFGLENCFYIDEPAYPTHVTVNVYKGKEAKPEDIKGVSEADFDGTNVTNIVCDDVACITSITVEDGMLKVCFTAAGYKSDGTFEAESYFEVCTEGAMPTDGDCFGMKLHTSCSKPLFMDRPYDLDPSGSMYIVGGNGTCLYDKGYCPPNVHDLWWIGGQFYLPCGFPADVTVNLYKDTGDLKSSATATVMMGGVTNVNNSFNVEITGGGKVGDDMVVSFMFYGTKSDGKFESNSRFEIVVDGCGTFYMDQHTSCSKTIYMHEYLDMEPDGQIIYLWACCEQGCCEGTSPVEDTTWGVIKGLYR